MSDRWTTELPTKPGWYWVKSTAKRKYFIDTRVEVIEVANIGGVLQTMEFIAVERECYVAWCGPLEPPSDSAVRKE